MSTGEKVVETCPHQSLRSLRGTFKACRHTFKSASAVGMGLGSVRLTERRLRQGGRDRSWRIPQLDTSGAASRRQSQPPLLCTASCQPRAGGGGGGGGATSTAQPFPPATRELPVPSTHRAGGRGTDQQRSLHGASAMTWGPICTGRPDPGSRPDLLQVT